MNKGFASTNRRGFTLVEILVAVSIFALVVTTAMAVFSVTAKSKYVVNVQKDTQSMGRRVIDTLKAEMAYSNAKDMLAGGSCYWGMAVLDSSDNLVTSFPTPLDLASSPGSKIRISSVRTKASSGDLYDHHLQEEMLLTKEFQIADKKLKNRLWATYSYPENPDKMKVLVYDWRDVTTDYFEVDTFKIEAEYSSDSGAGCSAQDPQQQPLLKVKELVVSEKDSPQGISQITLKGAIAGGALTYAHMRFDPEQIEDASYAF